MRLHTDRTFPSRVGAGAFVLALMSGSALASETEVARTMTGDGPTRTVTFLFDNLSGGSDLANAGFSETLDDGYVVASPSNAVNTCAGGMVIALPGSDTVDFMGGTVPARAACSIRVDVVGPDATVAADEQPQPDETAATQASLAEAPSAGTPLALGMAATEGGDAPLEVGQKPVEDGSASLAAGDFLETQREEIATRDTELSDRRNNRLNDDSKAFRVRARRNGDTRELSITTSIRRIISGAGSAVKASYNFSQDIPLPRGNGEDAGPVADTSDGPVGFDMWGRGAYVRSQEDGHDRETAAAHVGVDYRFTPGFAVGVMHQLDLSEDEIAEQGASAEAWGWLTGPYMVIRLPRNLVFDARAGMGESYNSIATADAPRQRFSAVRMLVRGQLAGDFVFGNVRFRPVGRALYYEEDEGPVNASGALARFEAGYEVSTEVRVGDGLTLSPRLAMRGSADYSPSDLAAGKIEPMSPQDMNARIEAALRLRSVLGWTLDAGGYYDGIGAKGDGTFGGKLELEVPLN